jgi:predicted DNA-binding antitoxin AbrB/MazE fold protein
MDNGTYIRAVHHHGVLELLDLVELPEGAQVKLLVLREDADLAYPTHLVPAEKLDSLTGLVAAGGDALADSEALYD